MNEDLEEILKDTTGEMGGTDSAYTSLLRLFQKNRMLLVPPRLLPGQVVFFTYKPVSEAFLNRRGHYDKYPLVVVTKVHKRGFEGVNLHYLSPKWRSKLFEIMTNQIPLLPPEEPEDWRSRFLIKENTLPSSARFRLYKPCFRRYLNEGVKRKPVVIPFDFWSDLVQANLAAFKTTGTSARRVQPQTIYTKTYKRFIRGD
jgi:hypothetical protein